MRTVSIILLLALVLATTPLVSASNSLDDIDNAINEGINYVYRSVIFIDEEWSKAVIRDHPAIPITLEYNGNYYMPGGFLDPGPRDYYHEFFNITSTGFSVRYYFNLDQDTTYDVIIRLDIVNINEVKDEVTIVVEECRVDGVKLIYGYAINEEIYTGWTKTLIVPYYYTSHYSHRYVARHSTRIAAWLLEDEGYDEFAEALNNFMDDLGFYYDVYAPLFDRSDNYPDYFFDLKYSTWLGNGYDAHPWITDYSRRIFLYPYKSRMYIFDAAGEFYTGLRAWKDAPLYLLLKATHLLNKYGLSRADEAKEYILTALEEGRWDGYGLSRALFDPEYVATGGSSIFRYPYHYEGYPVYLNAALLIAVVRYYQITGEQFIGEYDLLEIADTLAGILVKIQWIHTQRTIWGDLSLALFRGGWPACYFVDPSTGEITVAPSAWGIIDTATAMLDKVAGIVWYSYKILGMEPPVPETLYKAFLPMPGEFPTIVNSESTILAIQALKIYRQLIRTPEPIDIDIIFHRGAFIEGGGYGTSYSHGFTSLDGLIICSMAYTPGYNYRYQYARYLLRSTTDNGTIVIKGLASYNLWVGEQGGGAIIKLIVKVYDQDYNLIASFERDIANLTSPGEIDKREAIIEVFHVNGLNNTVIAEIAIKTIAVGQACADIGSISYGHFFRIQYISLISPIDENDYCL